MKQTHSNFPIPRLTILLFLCSMIIFGLVVLFLPSLQNRERVLAQCTGHLAANVHHHVTLHIFLDNVSMAIPSNIGIYGSCIHPVHTHDTTGTIHLDYPKAYPFTLGDFFTTWGIIFSSDQLANIMVHDGYGLYFTVNGNVRNDYERYILQDRDVIEIHIKKLPG